MPVQYLLTLSVVIYDAFNSICIFLLKNIFNNKEQIDFNKVAFKILI